MYICNQGRVHISCAKELQLARLPSCCSPSHLHRRLRWIAILLLLWAQARVGAASTGEDTTPGIQPGRYGCLLEPERTCAAGAYPSKAASAMHNPSERCHRRCTLHATGQGHAARCSPQAKASDLFLLAPCFAPFLCPAAHLISPGRQPPCGEESEEPTCCCALTHGQGRGASGTHGRGAQGADSLPQQGVASGDSGFQKDGLSSKVERFHLPANYRVTESTGGCQFPARQLMRSESRFSCFAPSPLVPQAGHAASWYI